MMEEKNAVRLPNNIILEDRKKLSVSGVHEIDSFDENIVVLFTDLGQLTVKGADLHISMLNVETGELAMDGEIAAVFYSEAPPKKSGGFLSRIFR